jgi:hypothetical protein
MTSFFMQPELESDEYKMLVGADSMRELLTIAASIMAELLDQLFESPATIYDNFASYADFCDWSRDFRADERSNDLWMFYWNAAAQIFEFYDRLPSLSEWDLHEEIFLRDRESFQMPDALEESKVSNHIIKTCFALSRWITGKIPGGDPIAPFAQ